MLKKLRDLLKPHDHFMADLARMTADEARAKDTETRIRESGLATESEIAAFTAARDARELIARRRPAVEDALRRIENRIKETLRSCLGHHNRAVRAAVEAKEAEIVEALRPFFRGELRQVKERAAQVQAPAVYDLRRLHIDVGFSPNPGVDFYARQARSFLDRSAKAAREFNLVIADS